MQDKKYGGKHRRDNSDILSYPFICRFNLTFYSCPMVSVTDISFKRFIGAFMPAATDRIKKAIITAISAIGSCHTE